MGLCMMTNLSAEEMKTAISDFNNIVKPWCAEKNYSLHQAFLVSRQLDHEKYRILSRLWCEEAGKQYLRSVFRQNNHFKNK